MSKKEDCMIVTYPKYSELKHLNKESFSTLAYLCEQEVASYFTATGFMAKWWREDDAIYNTILELIETCLEDLQKNPRKRSTECATGKLRVELVVYDEYGDGVERIVPKLCIEVWM